MNEKKIPAIRFQGFTDEWEHHKFGDIAKFINGRAYTQNELLPTGKYKVLRVGNFYTNESWYYSNLELAEKYYAEDGDLLYTWSATFGPHIWHGEKVIYHHHIWKVDVSDRLDKYFAMQLFEQDKHDILSGYNGSTMAHITKYGMEKKRVIIPPNIEEQKQLGIFLGKLDQLIALHQHKLTKLQLLKKSMLTKMFPKDGARVPEIRFQGFHDDWKLHPLNELAVFGGGHTPSMADEKKKKKDGICWVTSQDVKTDYLFDTRTKLSDKGASELKLYPDGTIIMVTRSGILRHTLPIALLKIPATVNQDIRTISVGLSCSSTWLMHYLKVHERELLLNYGKVGTTVESIDFSKLKTMDLLVPTMDEQEKIGAYFSRMDDLIAIHQHNIAKWQHIKQAMLSKLFA